MVDGMEGLTVAWFKVDDGLHDHRKARKVRRSHPEKRRDVSPFGLWVLAGSWAGGNGTSGFVPVEVLEEWDDNAAELAARLVDAGLWWPTVQDGEDGYGFHGWEERNPVNEVDSGRYGNHLRWHVKRDVSNPECEYCIGATRPDDRPDSGTTSPPESSPVPSRPDPTRKKGESDGADRFDDFWAAYPRRVDKGHAQKAWTKATKTTAAQVIIDATKRYAAKVASSDPKFIPHASTWLNGERWLDEDATTVSALFDAPTEVFQIPLPPADVADDPAAYQRWVLDKRAEWDARRAGGDR